ncbi:hypothetical protein [Candidatus Hodarchaeum mangrovi]
MVDIVDDAWDYLNLSIRTYVNATNTMHKLFALKTIVISMIIATDNLLTHYRDFPEARFQGYIEESSFFLPIEAYEQRVNDLIFLEETFKINPAFECSRRLRRAIDTLKIAYGHFGLRSLLIINIKDFINDAQFFIQDIQELIKKKKGSNHF